MENPQTDMEAPEAENGAVRPQQKGGCGFCLLLLLIGLMVTALLVIGYLFFNPEVGKRYMEEHHIPELNALLSSITPEPLTLTPTLPWTAPSAAITVEPTQLPPGIILLNKGGMNVLDTTWNKKIRVFVSAKNPIHTFSDLPSTSKIGVWSNTPLGPFNVTRYVSDLLLADMGGEYSKPLYLFPSLSEAFTSLDLYVIFADDSVSSVTGGVLVTFQQDPNRAQEPTATNTAMPVTYITVTVQPGDTCLSLMARYHIDKLELLTQKNNLAPDCSNLKENQTLYIPLPPQESTEQPASTQQKTCQMTEYTVQADDTLNGISQKFGVSELTIRENNAATISGKVVYQGMILKIPVCP